MGNKRIKNTFFVTGDFEQCDTRYMCVKRIIVEDCVGQILWRGCSMFARPIRLRECFCPTFSVCKRGVQTLSEVFIKLFDF